MVSASILLGSIRTVTFSHPTDGDKKEAKLILSQRFWTAKRNSILVVVSKLIIANLGIMRIKRQLRMDRRRDELVFGKVLFGHYF